MIQVTSKKSVYQLFFGGCHLLHSRRLILVSPIELIINGQHFSHLYQSVSAFRLTIIHGHTNSPGKHLRWSIL